MKTSEFNFLERYNLLEGQVILNGMQALVRIPIDQTRQDRRDGIRLGTYVTGYQGSPLGTVESHFGQVASLMKEYRVHFQAGINEDLAATAIGGTQMIEAVPHGEYDGVLGMWYGKSPGVDRSGDAFRHAAYTGTSKYGAVLTFAGDDPSSKSSTVPSDSTLELYDFNMPVFFPGNQQEILELGLKGVGLSRYTGLWTGIKIVTDVADSGSIVEVYPEQALQRLPEFEINGQPFQKNQTFMLIGPSSLEAERQILYDKTDATKAYVYENKIDQILVRSGKDRLGIISFGKSYYDLREALEVLGMDEDVLQHAGIRLYKLGMIAPIEPKRLREFAEGLEEIVVVEEKRGFTEMLIRNEFYNLPQRPQIYGKKGPQGQILFHSQSELKVSTIAITLAKFLADRYPEMNLLARVSKMEAIQQRTYEAVMPRLPYFCSGCPHNSSTVNPKGEVGGSGIGCHAMAMYMDRGLTVMTHMGAEGSNWMGMAPFTEKEHFFQHVGDGTYFHSASKSVEACIASGVNITFKILYNAAVAMTGGQSVKGGLDPISLAKKLECEGVKQIHIVTELLEKYPQKKISKRIKIVPKAKYPQSVLALKQIKGVTVLIYDQQCAAEKRRERKRGTLAIPRKRVMINEAVCEGCGDCGVQSNCLSVIPIQTEYGRKTQIHQSSCNFDYSCLKGDCPSFMTVELEEGAQRITKPITIQHVEHEELPKPNQQVHSKNPYRILMVGIGGTGVVTVSAIIVAAAHLEGKYAIHLDQTGLAQKGGGVTANISLCDTPRKLAFRIPSGQTDLLLAFDFLAAVAQDNLERVDKSRTTAIVNSHQTDTAFTITDIGTAFPKNEFLKHQLECHTQPENNLYLDANHISETLFANEQSNNIFMLGVAYQMGRIPLEAQSLETAIEGNGVMVEQNINAFRWGRKYALDPQKAMKILKQDSPETISVQDVALNKLRKFASNQVVALEKLSEQFPSNANLHAILYPRVSDLILFQNAQYAQHYLQFVIHVYHEENKRIASNDAIFTETVARWLFKLMAYKDEYEIARLWTQESAVANAKNAFEGRVKVSLHLHPPMLRKWGLKNKLQLGPWVLPLMKLLSHFKFLRGTPFNIFGRSELRQIETQLPAWYEDLIQQILPKLNEDNLQRALVLASLPDNIRGYEEIKMKHVRNTQKEAEEKLKNYLTAPKTPLAVSSENAISASQ